MRIKDYGKRNSKRMNEGKGRGGCLREALSRGALTKTRVWRKLTGVFSLRQTTWGRNKSMGLVDG